MTSRAEPVVRGFGPLFAEVSALFLMSSSLGRVPQAMMAVAALTYLPSTGAGFALAGLAAGAVGVGSALGAPVFGRLVDRFGPPNVLVGFTAVQALSFLALLFTAPRLVAAAGDRQGLLLPEGGVNPPVLFLLLHLALIGGSCPQIGAVARVVWRRAFGADARMTTAMSFESTVDELSFVIGPVLVGLLASMISPAAPLVLSAVLVSAAVLILVRSLPPVPPARQEQAEARLTLLTGSRIGVCALGMVSMGTVFGGTLTALLPFGVDHGIPESAGLLYGAMSFTSAVFALSLPLWGAKVSPQARWATAGALLSLAVLLLPAARTVPQMAAALLLLGIPVGPLMVTIFETAGLASPQEVLATVMTILGSGIVAGTALASAAAGSLAQSGGASAAFSVAAAGAFGVLITGVLQVLLARTRSSAAQ